MKETKTYIKFKDTPKVNNPEWLVVHHTAASEDQTVESIENYHLSLGWQGIGYHYIITKTGEIWKGRPEQMEGSHTKEQGMNKKSVSICLVGDFDKKIPTEAQKSSLRLILSELMAKYSIPLGRIVPHRFFLGNPPYKSCFGNLLSDSWARDLVSTPIIDKEKIKVEIKKLVDLL